MVEIVVSNLRLMKICIRNVCRRCLEIGTDRGGYLHLEPFYPCGEGDISLDCYYRIYAFTAFEIDLINENENKKYVFCNCIPAQSNRVL